LGNAKISPPTAGAGTHPGGAWRGLRREEGKATKGDATNKDVRKLLIRALTKTVEMMEALPRCDEDAAGAVAKLGHTAAEIASALELENSFAN